MKDKHGYFEAAVQYFIDNPSEINNRDDLLFIKNRAIGYDTVCYCLLTRESFVFPVNFKHWGMTIKELSDCDANFYGDETSLAFVAAEYGLLPSNIPSDWQFWFKTDSKRGITVAQQAAESGILPPYESGWQGWEPQVTKGCSETAFHAVRSGCLPDFDEDWIGWSWRISTGETVAHYGSIFNKLKNFSKNWVGWSWKDNYGVSVAACAVRRQSLPDFGEDWLGWKVTDNLGQTVAHYATSFGKKLDYSENWEGWRWYSNWGRTVAMEYLCNGDITLNDVIFSGDWKGWADIDFNRQTLAHHIAIKKVLPDFGKDWWGWGLSDKDGLTVAHYAAANGTLPDYYGKDWEGWSIACKAGYTVAYIANLFNNLPSYLKGSKIANNKVSTICSYEHIIDRDALGLTDKEFDNIIVNVEKDIGKAKSFSHYYQTRNSEGKLLLSELLYVYKESKCNTTEEHMPLLDLLSGDELMDASFVLSRKGLLKGIGKDCPIWYIKDINGTTVCDVENLDI